MTTGFEINQERTAKVVMRLFRIEDNQWQPLGDLSAVPEGKRIDTCESLPARIRKKGFICLGVGGSEPSSREQTYARPLSLAREKAIMFRCPSDSSVDARDFCAVETLPLGSKGGVSRRTLVERGYAVWRLNERRRASALA